MLNDTDGNILFHPRRGASAVSNPGFLLDPPGFTGTGFAVVQVWQRDTRASLTVGGRTVSQQPVTVRICGQRFRLAGLAFGDTGPPALLRAYRADRLDGSLPLPASDFAGPQRLDTTFLLGVWRNLEVSQAGLAAALAATPIGSGRTGGWSWQVTMSLGLYGQCYVTSVPGASAIRQCVPVSASPKVSALAWLFFPPTWPAQLAGYGGPVSPRTSYAVASFSEGTTQRYDARTAGGRVYLAFAFRQHTLEWLSLYDRHSHLIARIRSLPPAPA
jgi:hypothetical protein